MELIKEGVTEVMSRKEINMNIRRNITLEHCFGDEETQETTRRRKTPRWLFCTIKERKRKYIKGKVYLKQQLLKDTFATKRYGKGLLFKIKEEVYKIITEKEFTN